MTAAARLEALVGPNLAGAILAALREELAVELADRPAVAAGPRWLTLEQAGERLGVFGRRGSDARPARAPRAPPPGPAALCLGGVSRRPRGRE